MAASLAPAQTPDLQSVLQRLDRLEAQNRELMAEIRALRDQLASHPGSPGAVEASAEGQPEAAAPASPQVAEQVQVERNQISQLDQEKISTDHKMPLSLTGMLLFNSFWTGRAGGADNPIAAAAPSLPPESAGGATFRQSVVGVKFDGPEIAGGGRISGSAYVDFYGGSGGALNQLLRLRVASVEAAWKDTTLTLALDKPILAPREPDSLAHVGVSPLTWAGNLWLWQPQVRLERRFSLGSQAGLRAQAGLYETAESGTGVPQAYAASLSRARPGYEGRLEFWSQPSESRRIEIAPGYHWSDSHVLGTSVPSRIFTVDWLIRPVSRVDLTGAFFSGKNAGILGGLPQGIDFADRWRPQAVPAMGGWAQVKLRLTPRLTFNLYGGQEKDRNSYLSAGAIGRNLSYAANIMYRFGSNVLGSFEASQTRTTYLNSATRIFPHYDLGLAYLF
ncbi:MAG TPA: hypothetical protein VKV74_07380 [Bryobacteraceae bacterium]|nr:hypothetical protein [Bryobacteraceae bacterium]